MKNLTKKNWEDPTIQIDRFELVDTVATSNPNGQWQGYDGPDNPGDGGVDVSTGDDFWD